MTRYLVEHLGRDLGRYSILATIKAAVATTVKSSLASEGDMVGKLQIGHVFYMPGIVLEYDKA